jgi:hypothetical protein
MSHCEMCSLIRALSSRLRCFVTSSSRKAILIFLTIVVSHRLQLSTSSHVRLLHPPLHLVHHILRCPLAILQRCRDRRLHVSKHCWHPLRLPIRHDYPGTMTDFTKKTAVELKKTVQRGKGRNQRHKGHDDREAGKEGDRYGTGDRADRTSDRPDGDSHPKPSRHHEEDQRRRLEGCVPSERPRNLPHGTACTERGSPPTFRLRS